MRLARSPLRRRQIGAPETMDLPVVDVDGSGGKKDKKRRMPPGASKALKKVKEKALAPSELLKTLKKISPAKLGQAIAPAVAITTAVAGVTYAVANEREDARQLETAEVAQIQEQLDELENDVGSQTLPPTPTIARTTTAPDLSPSIAILAERVAELEGLDPADAARLDALAVELDNLPTPTTVDLGPLQSEVKAAQEVLDAQAEAAAESAAARAAQIEAQAAEIAALEELLASASSVQSEAAEAQAAAAAEIARLSEELEATAAALAEFEEFDPSDLEAADAAALAEAQAALAEAEAALAAAEAAQAEAEAAQADADDAAESVEEVSGAFYAQLIQDYAQGVPIDMTQHECVSGANTLLLDAGPGVSSFRSVSTPSTGGEGCKEFRPIIPVLPSACSFPSSGSAQVRLVGASSVSVTISGSGTARLSSSQGRIEEAGASGFVSRFNVTDSEVNEWDTFQFWPYDGSKTPYFQLYVQSDVTTQQFTASAGWTDAIFKGTISCQ